MAGWNDAGSEPIESIRGEEGGGRGGGRVGRNEPAPRVEVVCIRGAEHLRCIIKLQDYGHVHALPHLKQEEVVKGEVADGTMPVNILR